MTFQGPAVILEDNGSKGANSRFQTLSKMFCASFLIWTALSVLAMFQVYQLNLVNGSAQTLGNVALQPLLGYWIWSVLTVPLFLIAKRLPVTLKSLPWLLPVHFALFICATTASVLMRWSLSIVGLPAPWAAPLSAAIRNRFTEGFISSIWTYGAIIAAAHAIIYYTAVRERDINEARLREKLAQHQFQILKLRLHPHFLFNTLNAISALVVTDISAARTALADLSDMLRMTLNHSEHELISVRDEMNFVSSYLSLQKMRFSDRLTVAIDVDPGVLRARVPNMILQPLVENAIRHGIERLNAPGIVALRVWPRGSSLVMEVNNPTAGSRNIHGWGIGLSSVRTRLAALYGEDQSLEICKSEDSQIRVTVVIPLHWPVALEDVHSAATFAL